LKVRHYSLIQPVFKEEELNPWRVWPRLDGTQLAEGLIRLKQKQAQKSRQCILLRLFVF
jgi:hypothetical protein